MASSSTLPPSLRLHHRWPTADQLELIQKQKIQAASGDEYIPRGVCADLQNLTNPEMVISGPAGTGKSRACLEKLYRMALEYPGLRALIVRKTRTSLTDTGLMTFERDVLGLDNPLVINGPRRQFRHAYQLPNGSEIVTGGMDKPGRVLSSEYEIIFIQQAEELKEDEWETLISRNRGMAAPDCQIIGDCNPDAPTHWIKQRSNQDMPLLESRHEDNPLLWNEEAQEWTEYGEAYISKLDRLTGARKQRLRYGKWVQAEGAVFESYDVAIHLIDRFEIPADWRRFRVVDFGYKNPFVCQWWAMDNDGRMFRHREIYKTRRTVSEHAEQILELSEGESCEITVCDHDAEDRATLENYGIETIPAEKAVIAGIEKVEDRLVPDEHEETPRPRIFLLRDSLVETDQSLADAKKPLCTEQEFDGYVWANRATKEVPVKENDHGMDATRYAVMYVDGGPQVWTFDSPYD